MTEFIYVGNVGRATEDSPFFDVPVTNRNYRPWFGNQMRKALEKTAEFYIPVKPVRWFFDDRLGHVSIDTLGKWAWRYCKIEYFDRFIRVHYPHECDYEIISTLKRMFTNAERVLEPL